MRIISFTEDRKVIQTILKYPGLWLVKSRPISLGEREMVPRISDLPYLAASTGGKIELESLHSFLSSENARRSTSPHPSGDNFSLDTRFFF